MTIARLESIASRIVRDTLTSLPPVIRQEADACRIDLVDMAEALDAEDDLDPDLLGLFEGNARCDPLPAAPNEMPRIRLFLDNLWDESEGHLETFREEVRITLLHELGHYLGLDEAQVAALGLA
ncbi:MAG: metallopeptidase family protein [Verrucomicrobiaceae bacterium]|nr:metallopeptidase family protein [Verrucomicrobiaceae bacterium]